MPPEVTAASAGTTAAAASVESPRRLAAASAKATRIFEAKSAMAAPKVVVFSAEPTMCIFVAKSATVTPKGAKDNVSSPTATETLIPTHINTNRARIITTSTRYISLESVASIITQSCCMVGLIDIDEPF